MDTETRIQNFDSVLEVVDHFNDPREWPYAIGQMLIIYVHPNLPDDEKIRLCEYIICLRSKYGHGVRFCKLNVDEKSYVLNFKTTPQGYDKNVELQKTYKEWTGEDFKF